MSFPVVLLADLIDAQRLRLGFTLCASLGVALLFARGSSLKIIGALILLWRVAGYPMFGADWMLLGAMLAIGVGAWLLRPPGSEAGDDANATRGRRPTRFPAEPPEWDHDDEPAPCPACRGVIPGGDARCPNCGWTWNAAG